MDPVGARLGRLGDNEACPGRPSSPTRCSSARRRSRPGGVNSPVRAFNAVGGTPALHRAPARGAWLTDVDGNDYVDLICSWGPMLLGHAHPEVQEAAVREAVARGTSYGTPDRARGRAGRGDRGPDAGRAGPLRLLRHRGDDVGDPAGPRLHRPRRGREVRRLLPRPRRLAAGLAPAPGWPPSRCPARPACPASSTALTLVLPYNDRAAVEKVFAEHGDRIACLITEAAPGNMGVVPPEPGLQRASSPRPAARHGALFVSDEVMTGFRASRLGQWGLDGAVEGWRPGPDDLRQGDGRRLPGRGVRRPRRRDAPPRAGGAGLPGRHAVGEPGRDHRRPGHAAAGHRRGLRPPRPGSAT